MRGRCKQITEMICCLVLFMVQATSALATESTCKMACCTGAELQIETEPMQSVSKTDSCCLTSFATEFFAYASQGQISSAESQSDCSCCATELFWSPRQEDSTMTSSLEIPVLVADLSQPSVFLKSARILDFHRSIDRTDTFIAKPGQKNPMSMRAPPLV